MGVIVSLKMGKTAIMWLSLDLSNIYKIAIKIYIRIIILNKLYRLSYREV